MQLVHKLSQVQKLIAKGNLPKAKKLVIQLYKSHPGNEQVLKACTLVFARMADLKNAIFFADKLLAKDPRNFAYVTNLANWCIAVKKSERAINYYQEYIEHYPGNPSAYFQLGMLYKQEFEYQKAVDMLEHAIGNGFAPVEECYLQLALIHGEFRKETLAIGCLEKALDINPGQLVARLNLATLYQAAGRKPEAEDLYEQVLARDPTLSEALIRLVYSRKVTPDEMHLIEKTTDRVRSSLVPAIEKEGLNYALGKANDDLAEYEMAFQNYRSANLLQARRIGVYEPAGMKNYVAQSISKSSSAWVSKSVGDPEFEPIFVVGHFRSGSTLVEQILSGHSAIDALGEVDYFLRFHQEHKDSFQSLHEDEDQSALQELANGYKNLTSMMSEGSARITDKRPENLLYMGLIKKIFPKARFIHTRRNLLDNGVSVYFQQLNDFSRFATTLESFLDYDKECQKLMSHWRRIFGDCIYEITYENLVSEPQKYAKELISFLQLDWESACMDFENRKNFVRTASVSQVREKIYTSSVGRGMNYYQYFTDSEKVRYSAYSSADETTAD